MAEKRVRRPVVVCWASKLEALSESAQNFAAHLEGEFEAVATALDELSTASNKALTALGKVPVTFTISGGANVEWEEGDSFTLADEFAVLYTVKKNEVLEVAEVLRHGGNKDGKGSRIFLRAKYNSQVLTFPASHCEFQA